MYETGGMRRLHLRGRQNGLKRLVVHAAGFNLSLLMRVLTGAGTPRQATKRLLGPLFDLFSRLWRHQRRPKTLLTLLYPYDDNSLAQLARPLADASVA